MVPPVNVLGVGAVVLPVPPVAVVYHLRFVPDAVSAVETALLQYNIGVVTSGVGETVVPKKFLLNLIEPQD